MAKHPSSPKSSPKSSMKTKLALKLTQTKADGSASPTSPEPSITIQSSAIMEPQQQNQQQLQSIHPTTSAAQEPKNHRTASTLLGTSNNNNNNIVSGSSSPLIPSLGRQYSARSVFQQQQQHFSIHVYPPPLPTNGVPCGDAGDCSTKPKSNSTTTHLTTSRAPSKLDARLTSNNNSTLDLDDNSESEEEEESDENHRDFFITGLVSSPLASSQKNNNKQKQQEQQQQQYEFTPRFGHSTTWIDGAIIDENNNNNNINNSYSSSNTSSNSNSNSPRSRLLLQRSKTKHPSTLLLDGSPNFFDIYVFGGWTDARACSNELVVCRVKVRSELDEATLDNLYYHNAASFSDDQKSERGGKGVKESEDRIQFEWHKVDLHPYSPVPQPRMKHSATVYYKNNSIIVFGGFGDDYIAFNDVWQYHIKTKMWERWDNCTGSLPLPRGGHSASIIENKLYIFGGWRQSGGISDELYVLDLETRTWDKLDIPGGPTERCYHQSFSYRSTLYVLGGFGAGRASMESSQFDRLYAFDTEKNTWSKLQLKGHFEDGSIPEPRIEYSLAELFMPPLSSSTTTHYLGASGSASNLFRPLSQQREVFILGGIPFASLNDGSSVIHAAMATPPLPMPSSGNSYARGSTNSLSTSSNNSSSSSSKKPNPAAPKQGDEATVPTKAGASKWGSDAGVLFSLNPVTLQWKKYLPHTGNNAVTTTIPTSRTYQQQQHEQPTTEPTPTPTPPQSFSVPISSSLLAPSQAATTPAALLLDHHPLCCVRINRHERLLVMIGGRTATGRLCNNITYISFPEDHQQYMQELLMNKSRSETPEMRLQAEIYRHELAEHQRRQAEGVVSYLKKIITTPSGAVIEVSEETAALLADDEVSTENDAFLTKIRETNHANKQRIHQQQQLLLQQFDLDEALQQQPFYYGGDTGLSTRRSNTHKKSLNLKKLDFSFLHEDNNNNNNDNDNDNHAHSKSNSSEDRNNNNDNSNQEGIGTAFAASVVVGGGNDKENLDELFSRCWSRLERLDFKTDEFTLETLAPFYSATLNKQQQEEANASSGSISRGKRPQSSTPRPKSSYNNRDRYMVTTTATATTTTTTTTTARPPSASAAPTTSARRSKNDTDHGGDTDTKRSAIAEAKMIERKMTVETSKINASFSRQFYNKSFKFSSNNNNNNNGNDNDDRAASPPPSGLHRSSSSVDLEEYKKRRRPWSYSSRDNMPHLYQHAHEYDRPESSLSYEEAATLSELRASTPTGKQIYVTSASLRRGAGASGSGGSSGRHHHHHHPRPRAQSSSPTTSPSSSSSSVGSGSFRRTGGGGGGGIDVAVAEHNYRYHA